MAHALKQATRPNASVASRAGTSVPPQQLPTCSKFGTLLQVQGGPIESVANVRRWLEIKSWILAGEPYDLMKLACVLMTVVVTSKGLRIDSNAMNTVLAVALLMEEDAGDVYAGSLIDVIVSKLVKRIEFVAHCMASSSNCHDPLPTSETQPQPRGSNSPKTTPTTAPGPDRYPANSLGHHWPSPPVNTTSHHHLWHPRPSPAITAHCHHSHRHSRRPPAITAMTTTSALGLGYHTTSVPAPPITPGPRQDPHHASRSRITTDLTSACHALLPLPLTAPLPRVSAFPV
ncbi:hypothetical protein C0993_006925 [Termitomyces sp. T159_Od127]|nr:hypothetical protein C0993_006925 [Termitomyces sp. T159_Od127]